MRNLIITENITLDGVVEATEGWFSPAADAEVDDSDLIDALNQQMSAADAFLVGRVTFEEMRSYWPLQTDDETGVSDYLNSVQKYVISQTLTDPQWENSTVLSGPLDTEVRALKEQNGADIVTTGSITLARSLIDASLVDEFRLFVYPVVLGRGARLFEDATDLGRLERVDARPFRNGVVLLTYRPR